MGRVADQGVRSAASTRLHGLTAADRCRRCPPPRLWPRRFLHTFIAVGVTITAFGLFVAETLDIVIGASLAAAIMLLTGGCDKAGAACMRCAGADLPFALAMPVHGCVDHVCGASGAALRARKHIMACVVLLVNLAARPGPG